MKTEIPDLMLRYSLGGAEIAIDPVAASKEIDRIAETFKHRTDYSHLAEFVAWLKTHSGHEVSESVADWLIDHIRATVLREKKERTESWLRFSPPTQD